MALTQFIKELLYLNNKVIIPGFGGFVAQYTAARIDPEKNLLNPTVKNFIFDSSLTEDDGIFTTYISSIKSISISEATILVKEMVEDFRKKLNDGNTLLIEDVGYLFQDDQKVIRFKKDDIRNYDPEIFGLNGIVLTPVENVKTEENVDDTFYPVKRKRSVVKILIIFLILNVIGALSAFVYWKFDDIRSYFQKIPKQADATLPDTTSYKINPDTSEVGQHIDTSTYIENALRYEETPKENVPPVVTTPVEAEKTYYVIAGSFQTFEKADVHSKFLTKLGLKPEIIEFGANLYRISVGEYKGKDEALKQLELIKCKKGAENAWLLAK